MTRIDGEVGIKRDLSGIRHRVRIENGGTAELCGILTYSLDLGFLLLTIAIVEWRLDGSWEDGGDDRWGC